jgi:ATP-binding cassette, subfamily B, bacterial
MSFPRGRRSLLHYAIPYWRRLALVLACSLLGTALSLALPYLSKDLVDRALLGRNMQALFQILGMFVAITLVSFALNAVSGLRYTRVSAEILFDMRLALYEHLQKLSPRFYARTRMGEIVSRINNDIGEIQRIAAETALAWVGNVLFLIGSIAVLLWLDARLFLLSVALLPASLWALTHYRRRLESKVAALRQASADIGSFLIETLQGVKLVVTSNAQAREVDRFRRRNDTFIDALMSMQLLSYLSGGLPGLILSGSTLLVFLYGGHLVIQRALTLGSLVAFLAYQMRLFPPIQALMGLWAGIASARVSLGRVDQIFDTPPEVMEAPDAIPLPAIRGDVEFANVSLTFDRGAPVLDGVSFSLGAGETLAIVGPSGSGKSTIADLLLRLLDPDRGAVLLDGHDLRGVRLSDLRARVVLVDQEPSLFHTTIAENLRYARPEATQADLERAARAAGIADFIAGLPRGFDTVVGERGAELSAGERQRIAIARAFLADPAVLVLDEPTASLDPVSERSVIAGYEAVMRGRTTIIITHRLDLALEADRAIVLDGARVVESGAPIELRAAKGAFAQLFARSAAAR